MKNNTDSTPKPTLLHDNYLWSLTLSKPFSENHTVRYMDNKRKEMNWPMAF